MVVCINDLYQQILNQKQYLTALESLLQSYPTKQDLFKLLVVNHESDRHERHLLERFDEAQRSKTLLDNYRLKMANSIQSYWNQWLDTNHFGFWVDIADENTLELLGTGQLIKVEFNDWQVIVHAQLNTSKPMEMSRPDFMPRAICLPLAWQGSCECKDVVHARLEWHIFEIYDLSRKYIQFNGKIVDADLAYQEVKERHQSINWLWRWLFKMPSKDECFEQLESQYRFKEFSLYDGFKDKSITQKLMQNHQLQKDLLKALNPKAEKMQKQLNDIWHNQLNYPAIEFGQTVLHF